MANTLYEYYQSIGQSLPSVQNRASIYTKAGLGTNYQGTAQQNTALLNYLKKPNITPTTTPTSGLTQKQIDELNVAYNRSITGGLNDPTDKTNIDYAMKTYGWQPTIPNSQNVNQLSTGNTIPTVNPQVGDTASYVAALDPGNKGFESLIQQALTPPPAEAQIDPLVQKVSDLVGQTYQKPEDYRAELEKYGFNQNIADLQNLNTQIAAAKAQFDKLAEQNANRPIESRIIGGTADRIQRQAAIELGGLSSMAQALQGNINMATDIAQKMVDIKYEPIQMDIDNKKWQLEQIYSQLDREEKRRADALQLTLNERQRLIDENKEKETNISNIMMVAAQNGADSTILQKIMKATDIGSAIMAAGSYLQAQQAGKYDIFKGSDGVDYVFDPETGTVKPISQVGDPVLPSVGEYGGQCGDYLTSIMTGKPSLGDKYEEKLSKMNVSAKDYTPQVGDILLFETLMPYGHVAAISSIDGDKITITESNLKNDEKVGTRTFSLSELQKMKFRGAYRGAQFKNVSGGQVDSTVQGWVDLIASGKANITNVPADMRNQVASLLSQVTTSGEEKTDLAVQMKAQQALDLKDHKGFDSAVGAVALGRIAMPWNIGNKQEFIAGVEQLVSGLSLDSLIDAKARGAAFGSLSDTEMRILASAATKIGTWRVTDKNGKVTGYKVGHQAMKDELDNINKILMAQIGKTPTVGTTGVTSSGISYTITD